MEVSQLAERDELQELVAALGDSARTHRASAQLSSLIQAGGSAALLEALLARLLGPEGVHGAGARREA